MSDNGIEITPDGTIIATGEGIVLYALLTWRSALRLEISSGGKMKASRGVNAKTIIPELVRMGIIENVAPPFTAKKKIAAFEALDAYIVSKGGQSRPL